MVEAVLVACDTCGSGSVVHMETGDFVADLAEATKRELVFRKQVECPNCKAMVDLEFTLDKKTGQPKTAIHTGKAPKTNRKKDGSLSRLFGGSSETTDADEKAAQECKAFQAGRCVVRGVDSGQCSLDPSDWQRCGVVIENMKAYGQW